MCIVISEYLYALIQYTIYNKYLQNTHNNNYLCINMLNEFWYWTNCVCACVFRYGLWMIYSTDIHMNSIHTFMDMYRTAISQQKQQQYIIMKASECL